ncbi:SWIM zinc finger family protein [Psychrobium sp. MM17-31]|uniref:SWIM zinc finger family protein n=1 Tax=Psychrobium sp. MM17-31 TaxID=2917758 RepID=UPI001EF70F66|nr:SWIM zinc finger family protein [Psychrobium sp. MM17-31]
MNISLETIQELAPDQASLNAAKKLLKPAKWPVLEQAPAINTIWGECQGSGSKPYYTVADVVEHGYKCTCPSRKFPCKHVLALLWQFSDAQHGFADAEPPQWVHDWLGRRKRKPTAGSVEATKPTVAKDIGAITQEAKPLSPEELAKKEAAQAKRAASNKAKTDTSISEGLVEFQQWLDDQLLNGVTTFIKEVNERCRRIASRLVDAKATNFAARVDELPAKVMAADAAVQAEMVYQELGKLAMLSEAWFTDCNDVDVRRAVAKSETREQIISDEKALRITGIWQTVGEHIESRKDGLIAHAKWLINVDGRYQEPALLLDFYPASAGRKEMISSIDRLIEGELIFYPARQPLRAVLGEYQVITHASETPSYQISTHQAAFQRYLASSPWLESFPVLIGAGRIAQSESGDYWWSDQVSEQTIALSNKSINSVLLGSELSHAFVLSDGYKAQLMSANTLLWGTISC